MNMKKAILILLMSMLLFPLKMDAKAYIVKRPVEGDVPPRGPVQYNIGVYVDSETGDLYITPNYYITDLNITITGNGVTYLDTTVSLSANQSYTDCLDYLDIGTYILTLSTIDGVIDQYEITVEDD